MKTSSLTQKTLWTGIFAMAMAYLEAAVVVYLRKIFGISDVYGEIPPFDPTLGAVEIGREFSTLLMLLSLGIVAGKGVSSRLGFMIYAFGVWDIFYYVWLKVLIGWPESLLDWDILFLIPLPWWGPVIAPLIVAATMAIAGILFARLEEKGLKPKWNWACLLLLSASLLLILYTFMAEALGALPAAAPVLHQLRPVSFDWPLFLIGYGLSVFALGKAISGAFLSPPQNQPSIGKSPGNQGND